MSDDMMLGAALKAMAIFWAVVFIAAGSAIGWLIWG